MTDFSFVPVGNIAATPLRGINDFTGATGYQILDGSGTSVLESGTWQNGQMVPSGQLPGFSNIFAGGNQLGKSDDIYSAFSDFAKSPVGNTIAKGAAIAAGLPPQAVDVAAASGGGGNTTSDAGAGTASGISNWIARIAVILLGGIFVAVGLNMLRRNSTVVNIKQAVTP